MSIVISEFIHQQGLELLQKQYPVHYDPNLHRNPTILAQHLKNALGLIVRNQTKVTQELLQNCSHLKVIGRLGVGLDNISLVDTAAREIPVVYAPGANAQACAEHTLALIFALARNVPKADGAIRSGRWDRQNSTGIQLAGKTLGIVGYGRIGHRVANLAALLGMKVMVHRLTHSTGSPPLDLSFVPLELLLTHSDFVTLHLPLTPDTNGFFNAREFKLMKKGSYLINTARGQLVDEGALLAALKSGRLAGAALDVRQEEPPDPLCPLTQLPNIISTPHIGGLTREAQELVAVTIAEDVLAVLANRAPQFPVPAHEVSSQSHSRHLTATGS